VLSVSSNDQREWVVKNPRIKSCGTFNRRFGHLDKLATKAIKKTTENQKKPKKVKLES